MAATPQGYIRRFIPTPERLARVCRDRRAELGLTLLQVSEQANVPLRFYRSIEDGVPTARYAMVYQVMEALRIHVLALPSVVPDINPARIDLDKHLARYSRR